MSRRAFTAFSARWPAAANAVGGADTAGAAGRTGATATSAERFAIASAERSEATSFARFSSSCSRAIRPAAACGSLCAAAGAATWYDYARRVIKQGAELGMKLTATADSITAVTTAQFAAKAARPANSRLNTGRLRSTFGVEFPDWTVGVDSVLHQLSGLNR